MNLFVSCDGDSIGARVGKASLADEVEECRRLSKVINDGNELFTKWALGVGGDVVSAGGDEIVVMVEASHIIDVPALREQYFDLVGATITVGIGLKLSEAQKSLFVGKLEGKDRIQTYDAQVEASFQRAREYYLAEDSAEVEKLGQEYLNAPTPEMKKSDDPHEQQLLDDAEAPHEAPGKKENPKDYEKEFHAAAERSGKSQSDAHKQQELDELKQKVGGVLQTLRGQQDVLAKLASAKPDLANALNEMVQSMIEMGQQLFAKPEDKVQKSEAEACPECRGSDGEKIGGQWRTGKCDDCHGGGDVKGRKCNNCQGTGTPPCCRCEGTGNESPMAKVEVGMGKHTGCGGVITQHMDADNDSGSLTCTKCKKPVGFNEMAGVVKADPDEQDNQLDLDVEKGGPEGEIAPGRTKPVSEAFDKAAPVAARSNVVSPVGTVKQPGPGGSRDVGKLKVTHASGKDGWQGVRSGLVGSPTGRPTSARNPKGAPQDKPGQTPEHFEQDEAPG